MTPSDCERMRRALCRQFDGCNGSLHFCPSSSSSPAMSQSVSRRCHRQCVCVCVWEVKHKVPAQTIIEVNGKQIDITTRYVPCSARYSIQIDSYACNDRHPFGGAIVAMMQWPRHSNRKPHYLSRPLALALSLYHFSVCFGTDKFRNNTHSGYTMKWFFLPNFLCVCVYDALHSNIPCGVPHIRLYVQTAGQQCACTMQSFGFCGHFVLEPRAQHSWL